MTSSSVWLTHGRQKKGFSNKTQNNTTFLCTIVTVDCPYANKRWEQCSSHLPHKPILTSRAQLRQQSLHNASVVYRGPPTAESHLHIIAHKHTKNLLFHFLHFIPWEVCQVAMGCGCHNNSKVVLLTAQQWMSHSVGGLAPGLQVKTRTSHCHYTGSLLLK